MTLGGLELHVAGRAGSGTSSDVWCVNDESGRSFALKLGREDGEAKRLGSEAERLITVSSPHLAEVIDAGTAGLLGH